LEQMPFMIEFQEEYNIRLLNVIEKCLAPTKLQPIKQLGAKLFLLKTIHIIKKKLTNFLWAFLSYA